MHHSPESYGGGLSDIPPVDISAFEQQPYDLTDIYDKAKRTHPELVAWIQKEAERLGMTANEKNIHIRACMSILAIYEFKAQRDDVAAQLTALLEGSPGGTTNTDPPVTA